jgi:CRP-like cAMP-binding protein/HEAT repeat protein
MITRRVQEVFNLEPGEGHMASLVMGYAILLFSSNVLAITASLGLFFGPYDAATLPYTYVVLMFIGPLTSLIYLRLEGRFSLSRTLLIVHVALLFSLILLPLILSRSEAPVLRFILPVYLEVNVILTYASFWNLLGRIYNLRQGKRLFPFLGSGEHLATIGAGFIATFLVARTATENLYWLSAFFMIGAVFLLLMISRANVEKMGSSAVDGDTDQGGEMTNAISDMKALVQEPYLRLLFVIVMLYTISVVLVENLSFIEAEIRFPTADGMATYVGLFMGIYGVLGLFVQWVLAGRALDRFGVSAVVLALPGGLLLIYFIFALVGSFNAAAAGLFWLASGANMYAYILDAPYMAAKNVMLQPLPANLRTRIQTTTTGIAYPLATGLSGLLMLLMLNVLNFGSVQIAYATLLILLLWTAAGFRLGRDYMRQLRQALLARSLGGPGLLQAADRTSISVLEAALKDSQPAVVLYALETLAEVAPGSLPEHLPDLLTYANDDVRVAALARVPEVAWRATPPGIKSLLERNNSAEVRAAALRTWYALSPREASLNLAAYSQDPDLPVRQAALAMMFKQDDPFSRQEAREALDALCYSADTADRILAAEVLGELDSGEEGEQVFLDLLNDEDLLVRRAALVSAATLRLPAIWPVVIPALAGKSTTVWAANALIAAGEDVLPLLRSVALADDQDPLVVAEIASVCGRIGGPQAISILEPLLSHQEAAVRRQAMLGLSHNAYRATDSEQKVIEQQFYAQAANVAEITAALVDLGNERQVRLVVDALAQKRQEEMDNLLLLLSFLYDSQAVLGAREVLGLYQVDAEKRAYAMEMLDIVLDHEQKRILFPFLRHMDLQRCLAGLEKEFPQTLLGSERRLRALLAANSPLSGRWTRICAIYALGLLEDGQAKQAIFDVLAAAGDDSVLVETALTSLENLGGIQELDMASNPDLEKEIEIWQTRDPQEIPLLQKAESIKQTRIFAGLQKDLLEAMAGLVTVVAVKPRQTLFHEGDPGDSLYIVDEGQLRVHLGDRFIDTVAAGGVIGEMALFDDGPRSASVKGSAENSRLLQLDREPFYDFLANNVQVAREFMHLLSRRLRERTADLALQTEHEPLKPAQPITGGQMGARQNVSFAGELRDVDKLLFLKGTSFFRGIDDDLLEQVALLLEEVNLACGEQLFAQGDSGQSLYIITAGQVRIHIEERTLAYASEGEVIGEMALLESEPRLATVTGSEGTQLLRLDQQPFFELLWSQPELALAIIRMLSGRVRTRLQELSK